MFKSEERLRLDRVHICYQLGCASAHDIRYGAQFEGICRDYGKVEPITIDLEKFDPHHWFETTNYCMHPDAVLIEAGMICVTSRGSTQLAGRGLNDWIPPPDLRNPRRDSQIAIREWSPVTMIGSEAAQQNKIHQVRLPKGYITRRQLVEKIKTFYPRSTLKSMLYKLGDHSINGTWVGLVVCDLDG